ncbi:MAG: GMC family oxidoreductase [Burkholderiales bacterium]|nr:GMC family oxidoreductase [Burkholderiales bacterium]
MKSGSDGGASFDYDYIIIGSGFGGAVSALRLSEKGYKVLVLEKGMRMGAADFPKSNWNVKRWLWLPSMRCFGLFKLTFFRHVGVLSGVGVGGGSLVYANTLPIPKKSFFTSPSWAHLADWETELRDYYQTALRMLGAATNPRMETGDLALRELGRQIGMEQHFEATKVSVFFGEPGKTVPDPYFKGKGPARAGCTFCGGCMTGCRHNAKNSLDKNYLHLAEQLGAVIQAESLVTDVRPLGASDGADGYAVDWQPSATRKGAGGTLRCRGAVFAGGVLGTLELMLKLKQGSLPRLSDRLGYGVRTNSEALVFVTTPDRKSVFSDGIAIGSILHTDEHSHLEPVRYSAGSGFWRLGSGPRVYHRSGAVRLLKLLGDWLLHPVMNLKVLFVDDWAKRTQVLLFMQTIDSTLRMVRGSFGLSTKLDVGPAPTAFMPEARDLSERYAAIVGGKPMAFVSESLFGIPSTAHILGGACMGRNAGEGVIDSDNRVFGYRNLYVCDGSMISANPGVNPSLSITAISERAMSKLPPRNPQAKRAGTA